jgi:hypothetical protein
MARFFKQTLWKLSPKLRLVANGSATVNAVRAEGCGSVAVDADSALSELPERRAEGTRSANFHYRPKNVLEWSERVKRQLGPRSGISPPSERAARCEVRFRD